MKLQRSSGFTLVELMIVVAIIGILAVIAIPKFGDLVNHANEAKIRGDLGALRSAVTIYYSDNLVTPSTLSNSLEVGGRYIAAIPTVHVPPAAGTLNPGHHAIGGDTNVIDDMVTAGWFYNPTGGDNSLTTVNCTHNDSRGLVWSAS